MQDKKQFRVTTQRTLILEEVKKGRSHLTADEIFARVRKKMPNISLATIYRNLEKMAGCGLISKLEPGRPRRLFEHETGGHFHVTCLRCGTLENTGSETLKQASANLGHALKNLNEPGITGHRLEFVGLCKKCRTSKLHA